MRETALQDQNQRRYLVEFFGAISACVLAVVVAKLLVTELGDSAWRYPVAGLPGLVFGVAMWTVVRQYRRMDELHRRVQLEALAAAFGITAFVALTTGFLQDAGLPLLHWYWIWPVMAVAWTLSLFAATWRYAR